MPFRPALALSVLALSVLALSVLTLIPISQAKTAAPDYAYLVQSWQGHDARLLSIGTQLARANAPLCLRVQPSIGLMLTDFAKFKSPAAARAVLGLSGDIAVEAVARGGPAEAAGLRAGDEVLAISGVSVTTAPAREKPEARLARLHQNISMALATQGRVTLKAAGRGQPARDVSITGTAACRSHFALIGWGKIAKADGEQVEISIGLFAEFAADDEAAAMIAHELAHNILGHQQRSNAAGRNYKTIRQFEREADRLAPWLMANAGYDPAAAPRFMARWGEAHDQGITRAPTHDGYKQRIAAIAAELPLIAEARRGNPTGLLDWRSRTASPISE